MVCSENLLLQSCRSLSVGRALQHSEPWENWGSCLATSATSIPDKGGAPSESSSSASSMDFMIMELTILFFFTPTDYTWLAVRSSDPILTVESQDKGMLPAPELPDGLPCFPLPLYLDGLPYLWYSQACLGFTTTTGTSNLVTPAANNPFGNGITKHGPLRFHVTRHPGMWPKLCSA